MAQNACPPPDSWDLPENNGVVDAEMAELTAKALNVDAVPFVPGQNVFAKEFVPSVGNGSPASSAAAATDATSSTTKQETSSRLEFVPSPSGLLPLPP